MASLKITVFAFGSPKTLENMLKIEDCFFTGEDGTDFEFI